MHQPGQLDSLKSKGRSRVTNARATGRVTAKTLFTGEIDGRSIWARRYRDLVCSYVDDAGGLAVLSELRVSLIRRLAALTVEAERLETDLASGRTVDIDLLARLSSHIRRIAETIGLDRAVKDVTPSLSDIIAKSQPKPQSAQRLAHTRKASASTIIEGEATEPSHASPDPLGMAK